METKRGPLDNPATLVAALRIEAQRRSGVVPDEQTQRYLDGGAEVLADAILGGMDPSDAIEAQEKRGQQELVNSARLPKEMNGCTREELEAVGFAFGEEIDDLFVAATLPEGWTKRASDHDMWSHVCDERGRERLAVFFKGAFYDRKAFMRPCPRFRVETENLRAEDWAGPRRQTVKDADGQVLFATEYLEQPASDAAREASTAFYNADDANRKLAEAWLTEHYPDWQNSFAYWDAP